MDERSSLDPVEEARARVKLRHTRARPVRPPPKPIGLAASRFVRAKAKGKGPALERLKSGWREIVGEDYFRLCRPEKLTGTKDGRVLTLKVLPAAAVMIQHQSETLRQRISAAAGGDITAIRLVQGPLTANLRGPRSPLRRPLRPDEKAELEAGAARFTDPALRRAIVALGEAMLTAEPDKS